MSLAARRDRLSVTPEQSGSGSVCWCPARLGSLRWSRFGSAQSLRRLSASRSASHIQDGGATKPCALTGSDLRDSVPRDWLNGPSSGVCCC
eukprot:superscaffoldBa00006625_g21730